MFRLDQSGLTSERLDVVITMNEQFLKLPSEKQQRILHAALAEFARQGYEKASTNRIVKEAGIGKGMLFYYFNSKEELYNDLIEYALQIVTKHYVDRIDIEEQDIIAWMCRIAQIKLNYFSQYPEVNDFLSRLLMIDGIPDRFKVRFDALFTKGLSILRRKIEESTPFFRDDVDPKAIARLLYLVMKGYQQDQLERLRGKKLSDSALKPLWDEFFELLDVLKKVFYK